MQGHDFPSMSMHAGKSSVKHDSRYKHIFLYYNHDVIVLVLSKAVFRGHV